MAKAVPIAADGQTEMKTRMIPKAMAADRFRPACSFFRSLMLLAFAGGSPALAGDAALFFQVGAQDPGSERPATLQIFLSPGSGGVSRISFRIPFPATLYRSVRATGCSTMHRCHMDIAARTLVLDARAAPGQPLAAEFMCEVEARFGADAAAGFHVLTLEDVQVEALDGGTLPVVWADNRILALQAWQGSTALAFAPAPDHDCDGGEAQVRANAQGRATVAVEALEPLARHPLALSCGVSEGLIGVSGLDQSYPSESLRPIEMQCAESPSGQRRELVCLEGSSGGERAIRWTIDCEGRLFEDGFEPT